MCIYKVCGKPLFELSLERIDFFKCSMHCYEVKIVNLEKKKKKIIISHINEV